MNSSINVNDTLDPTHTWERYRTRAAHALKDTLLNPPTRGGRFCGRYSALLAWRDEDGELDVRHLKDNGRLVIDYEKDEWELTDATTTPLKKKCGMEIYGLRIQILLKKIE